MISTDSIKQFLKVQSLCWEESIETGPLRPVDETLPESKLSPEEIRACLRPQDHVSADSGFIVREGTQSQ
jgi:hypothetical protein